jgi:hypothetical protein
MAQNVPRVVDSIGTSPRITPKKQPTQMVPRLQNHAPKSRVRPHQNLSV